MHEMSIAMTIIGIVETEAKQQSARRVTQVSLEVGELAGVAPDALTFCWQVCCQDSIAANSCLIITSVAAQAHCPNCPLDFHPEYRFFNCPQCQGPAHLSAGETLAVTDIEIEE